MASKEPHTLRFVSIDGKVFHLRVRSLAEVMFDASFLLFVAICSTLFVSVIRLSLLEDYPNATSPTTPGAHLLVDVFSVVMLAFLVLVPLVAQMVIFYRLALWGLIKTIPVPLLYVLPIMAFGVVQHERDVFGPQVTAAIYTFTLIFACFDMLHGRFVAPHHSKYFDPDELGSATEHKDVASNTTAVATTEPSTDEALKKQAAVPATGASEIPEPKAQDLPTEVKIGRQSFALDTLRRITSEGHYLNVVSTTGAKLVFGKLTATVAQIPEDFGVQVNRSDWIAHEAIESFDVQSSRKMYVVLTDGQRVKVTDRWKEPLESSHQRFKESTVTV